MEKTGFMDPTIIKIYLLVSADAEITISFQKTFRNTLLLSDNSSNVVKSLSKIVSDYMAQQIQEWEREVASAKRGISSRLFKVGLKYFGSQKSATVMPFSQTGVIFAYNSPEMILRRLGDYAYMIQDYKYALGIYELVKKDLGTSTNPRFICGLKEMIALCSLIQEVKNSTLNLIDSAIIGYNEAGMDRFGTRLTLLALEILKSLRLDQDASLLLIRMSSDVALPFI